VLAPGKHPETGRGLFCMRARTVAGILPYSSIFNHHPRVLLTWGEYGTGIVGCIISGDDDAHSTHFSRGLFKDWERKFFALIRSMGIFFRTLPNCEELELVAAPDFPRR